MITHIVLGVKAIVALTAIRPAKKKTFTELRKMARPASCGQYRKINYFTNLHQISL